MKMIASKQFTSCFLCSLFTRRAQDCLWCFMKGSGCRVERALIVQIALEQAEVAKLKEQVAQLLAKRNVQAKA